MKTKFISNIAAGLLLAAGFSACSDNWTADIDGNGEGQLRTSTIVPSVMNEDQFPAINDVASAKKAPSRSTIDLSGFLVDVVDASGNSAASWTLSTMPGLPTFPVGTYTIKVRSHEVQPAEWNKPYFLGEQTFAIRNGEITEVEPIVCKLANIRMTVIFDSKLLEASDNGGADFKVTVTSTPGTSLDFTPSTEGSGYFEAAEGLSTLKVAFTGKVSGVEENTTAVLTNVEAGQHRKLTISLKKNGNVPDDEKGNITVDNEGINVDFSVEEVDMTGDIAADEDVDNSQEESPWGPEGKPDDGDKDPELPTPPTPDDNVIKFVSETLNLEGANNADEFGPGVKDAIVLITSQKGVKNLLVEIESDFLTDEFLTEFGLATSFDLANAPGDPSDDSSLVARLKSLGFPVNAEVVGKGVDEPLKFDITTFMPLILEAGDHKFHITVTDLDGNSKGMTLLIRKS